jgi:3-deoxy-manno-octulosonate cytidylyltransferase (CMP-KDO synthetase)
VKDRFVIIIPARLKSTRFPGKPLIDICGKSMIQHVWERCCLALPEQLVYVATDSTKIAKHCQNLGIQVIMTPESCLTGTDRVYEASKQVDAEIYINVQGDEPLIDPQDIKNVIECSSASPDDIVSAMCSIENEIDFYSSSVPKVVTRPDGRLLYMSRAAIPTNKNLGFMLAKKQVCIYAFPKTTLEKFASVNSKTALEQIEDIEVLRFLELGYEVKMTEVSSSSVAIDFPEDVIRVENIINEKY